MLLDSLAAVPLLIWIYLSGFRGGFWLISRHFAPIEIADVTAKRVVVVIPARNEAAVIGHALASVFAQDFPTPLHVFLVDDASTDDTAEVAAAAAERAGKRTSLTIVPSQPLAPGWTGKLWALSQGIRRAERFAPDYLLLTDADIVHASHAVAELVGIAESYRCDLVSYMVKLACRSLAEKALIPAFVFFFLKLYPPAWIASESSRTAGGAGGCILVRPAALQRIGGLSAIRNETIDDCALAKAVKQSGGRIWMGLTSTTESIRSYGTFAQIGQMISRTAFNQLQHSPPLLIGTLAGLALTYLLPPLLLLTGRMPAIVFGLLAWTLMSVAYSPTVRFYKLPLTWCLCLPLVACFYGGATLYSAVQYWRGIGGEWKGRVQDARP